MSEESYKQTKQSKSALEELPETIIKATGTILRIVALYFLAVSLVISVLMFLVIRYGLQVFQAFVKAVGMQPAQGILAVGTIGFAFGVFEFKRKHLWWYAIVETAFGFVSVFTVSIRIHPASWSLVQLISLAGCVYIIVRGLGNFVEARRKRGRGK